MLLLLLLLLLLTYNLHHCEPLERVEHYLFSTCTAKAGARERLREHQQSTVVVEARYRESDAMSAPARDLNARFEDAAPSRAAIQRFPLRRRSSRFERDSIEIMQISK